MEYKAQSKGGLNTIASYRKSIDLVDKWMKSLHSGKPVGYIIPEQHREQTLELMSRIARERYNGLELVFTKSSEQENFYSVSLKSI